MRQFSMVMRLSIIALSFFLACCAHKPAPVFDNIPECTTMHLPADEEFMTMPYATLYQWHKQALQAQDILSLKTVTGQPVDPCITTLAYKGYTAIDQALKYR